MFPKNAWYVACTPDELTDGPLGRTICGQPVALYRGAQGKVAALEGGVAALAQVAALACDPGRDRGEPACDPRKLLR